MITSGLFKFNNKKISNKITLIGVIILILISITRFDVGYDYISYYNFIYPIYDYEYTERLEYGYQLILMFSYSINEPQAQFVIVGLITYFLTFITIWKFSNNIGLSILIYVGLCYLSTLSEVRQALAVSMVFFSIRYIINKKLLKFIITIIVASLFHSTALIAILFYPLCNWITKKKLIIFSFCATIALSALLKILVNNPLFIVYSSHLDPTAKVREGGSIMMYIYLFIWFVQFLVFLKKTNTIYFKLIIIAFPSVILPFIIGGHLGMRISQYFIIFYTLTIPYLLKNKSYKWKAGIGIGFSIYFVLLVYIASLNSLRPAYTPYQNIFFVERNPPHFKGEFY